MFTENKNVNDKTSENRIYYIDAIRVSAILAVILLHTIGSYWDDPLNYGKASWWLVGYLNELGRVGVPLFFMISGFLLLSSPKTEQPLPFYRHSLPKLIVPLVIWHTIYYCLDCLMTAAPLFRVEYFRTLFETGSSYHFWFMYSMIFLYLYMPFVKKLIESSSKRQQLFFFLLIVFQSTLKPAVNLLLQDRLYVYLTSEGYIGYLGYILLGYLLGAASISKRKQYMLFALGAASGLVFPLINGRFAMASRGFLFNGGYTLNHYIEAAALFLFMKSLSWKSFNRLLTALSGLCINVYFVHAFILTLLSDYFKFLPLRLYFPVVFTATALLSFAAAYVINKLKTITKFKVLSRSEKV